MNKFEFFDTTGYRKKLDNKLRKLVGRDTTVGSKFSKSAEGPLNLEAMIGML